MSITIVLTILFIVLVFVRDKVLHGEAIMIRDVVDGEFVRPMRGAVDVARSHQASCKLFQVALITAPEAASDVSELVVTLIPTEWEITHLIAVRADIPWFCDELGFFEHWILSNGFEESSLRIVIIAFTAQCRCQIKTEAVYLELTNPVTKGIHDQVKCWLVSKVDRITATSEVRVMTTMLNVVAVI